MTAARTPSLDDFVALAGEARDLIPQVAAKSDLEIFPVPTPSGGEISAGHVVAQMNDLIRVANELQHFASIYWEVRSIPSSGSGSSTDRPVLEGGQPDKAARFAPYDMVIIALGEWTCPDGRPAHTLTISNGGEGFAQCDEYYLASLSNEFDLLIAGTDCLSGLVGDGKDLLSGINAKDNFESKLQHLLRIHDAEFRSLRHQKIPEVRAFYRVKCDIYEGLRQNFSGLDSVFRTEAINGIVQQSEEVVRIKRQESISIFLRLMGLFPDDVGASVKFNKTAVEAIEVLKRCTGQVVLEVHSCLVDEHCGYNGLNNGKVKEALDKLGCQPLKTLK